MTAVPVIAPATLWVFVLRVRVRKGVLVLAVHNLTASAHRVTGVVVAPTCAAAADPARSGPIIASLPRVHYRALDALGHSASLASLRPTSVRPRVPVSSPQLAAGCWISSALLHTEAAAVPAALTFRVCSAARSTREGIPRGTHSRRTSRLQQSSETTADRKSVV